MERFKLSDNNEVTKINLFHQELALIENLPRNFMTPNQIEKYEKPWINELQKTPIWKEQCQVIKWACKRVDPNWDINVLYDNNQIPLYYFIVDTKSRQMRGIWKSIVGTLSYLNKYFPKGRAVELLKFGLSVFEPGTIVHVSAREPLIRMLERNNIKLYLIDKPKTQGGSVPAHLITPIKKIL
jgi:hypothetical protein